MKTIGQFLIEARHKSKLSLEEAAGILKVRPEFLSALEKDQYESLPAEVYIKGFLRKYAKTLSYDSDHLLALFRRSYNQQKQLKSAPPQPIKKTIFSITPNFIIASSISLVIIIFLSFLFWQYRNYTNKPVLVIQSPQNQAVLYQDYVEIIGKTDPNASILINGQFTEVNEDGSFAVAIGLNKGLNDLTITARGRTGKETTVQRRVEVIINNNSES